MFALTTPKVEMTPQGQVTVDLARAMEDFLCDLANKVAVNGEAIVEQCQDLAACLQNQVDGPTDETSTDVLSSRVHGAIESLMEELNLADSYLLYMPTFTARHLAADLLRECEVATYMKEMEREL